MALLLAAGMTSAALADDRPAALIERWQGANSACRGSSGGDPRTLKACAEREAVARRLAMNGWCYGRRGERGHQMEWHLCGPYSIRPGR